jgi:hypothetical protein
LSWPIASTFEGSWRFASSEGSNFSSFSMSAALGAVPRTGLSGSDSFPAFRELWALDALLRAFGALELEDLLFELEDRPFELEVLLLAEPEDLDRLPPRELPELDDEDRSPDLRLSAIPAATIPPVRRTRATSSGGGKIIG